MFVTASPKGPNAEHDIQTHSSDHDRQVRTLTVIDLTFVFYSPDVKLIIEGEELSLDVIRRMEGKRAARRWLAQRSPQCQREPKAQVSTLRA